MKEAQVEEAIPSLTCTLDNAPAVLGTISVVQTQALFWRRHAGSRSAKVDAPRFVQDAGAADCRVWAAHPSNTVAGQFGDVLGAEAQA